MTEPHAQTDPPSANPFGHAHTRDWPGYFAAASGRPPRDTLLRAIELFKNEQLPADPFAVDLGCGDGRDSAELLRNGWRVHAIDGHPEAIQRLVGRDDLVESHRLTMQLAPMESVALPACDLLNASFSLPFCLPDRFDGMWARIVASIRPGGRFSGQIFGDRDSWATIADRSHHTRAQTESMLKQFELEQFDEVERDGEDSSKTPKHWHVFHVVARKL